jgi:hypothetical protein
VGRSGGVLWLLHARYGLLVTSATVGARAHRSVDWEEKERGTSLSTGRGPGFSNRGLTAERGGTSSGTARLARTYEQDVSYSERSFSEILPTRCSIKCPHEFKFRIFEKFHFGLSTY